MRRPLQFLIPIPCVIASLEASEPHNTMPDTWAATDALGRVLPKSAEVGTPKANRTVGIFYFNWHAAFGNQEVHDIAKILKANPTGPVWGPVQAPHYWSEPRFGYYRPDDPWVIRKHVQMLTDAGVDMIALDATNGFTYDTEREALCTVLEQMKAEGQRVPQIAMFAYAQHNAVVQHLWETFYKPGKHRELWFQWKGKPLLLTPPEGLSEEVKAFFTIRTSWAWTRSHAWFGDGKDKWPWLDFAPQVPGWHDAPNKAECVPVGVSQPSGAAFTAASSHRLRNVGPVRGPTLMSSGNTPCRTIQSSSSSQAGMSGWPSVSSPMAA